VTPGPSPAAACPIVQLWFDNVSRAVLHSVLGLGERDFDKKVIDFTNNLHLAPLIKPGVLPVIWESYVKTSRRTVLNPIDNQGEQLLVDWIGTYSILLSTALLINILHLITFRTESAECMCLVDGRLIIVPLIIPEAQEFVHFNNLWCYLFYKLTGEEKRFYDCPGKELDHCSPLGQSFPRHPGIRQHANAVCHHQDSRLHLRPRHRLCHHLSSRLPDSPALQHEASILEALNDMPADEFRTELSDSLTAFYQNILKKTGAGGRPVAKPLIRKFVTKAAPVPEDPPSGKAGADNNAANAAIEPSAAAVEPPSAAPAQPAPEKEAPLTPPVQRTRRGPAPKGSKGAKG
jgi:hypothetical protein